MTGSMINGIPLLSKLTTAILDDTGYYETVNYNMATGSASF
jgi:hypothetical protein